MPGRVSPYIMETRSKCQFSILIRRVHSPLTFGGSRDRVFAVKDVEYEGENGLAKRQKRQIRGDAQEMQVDLNGSMVGALSRGREMRRVESNDVIRLLRLTWAKSPFLLSLSSGSQFRRCAGNVLDTDYMESLICIPELVAQKLVAVSTVSAGFEVPRFSRAPQQGPVGS